MLQALTSRVAWTSCCARHKSKPDWIGCASPRRPPGGLAPVPLARNSEGVCVRVQCSGQVLSARLLCYGRGMPFEPLSYSLAMLTGPGWRGGLTSFTYAGANFDRPQSVQELPCMNDQCASWSRGPHHVAATCDGHLPHEFIPKYLPAKANNGYWHSKGFTLMDFHEPITIDARNAADVARTTAYAIGDVVHDILRGRIRPLTT